MNAAAPLAPAPPVRRAPLRDAEAASPRAGPARDHARIGPNAITRVAEALRERVGEADTVRVFVEAGLDAYLPAMPVAMVDEAEVVRLHRALRTAFGADGARAISRDAGTRTGDYLLAHRIPVPVKVLLRLLPAAIAARGLVRAIERNRWTFCGSARLATRQGPPVQFILAGCALCRDAHGDDMMCDYYAATFERLFRTLVAGNAVVTETECEATGGGACVFEVRW
jgi:divinyl protochlorophyllide a 8-vinyl-reductase